MRKSAPTGYTYKAIHITEVDSTRDRSYNPGLHPEEKRKSGSEFQGTLHSGFSGIRSAVLLQRKAGAKNTAHVTCMGMQMLWESSNRQMAAPSTLFLFQAGMRFPHQLMDHTLGAIPFFPVPRADFRKKFHVPFGPRNR